MPGTPNPDCKKNECTFPHCTCDVDLEDLPKDYEGMPGNSTQAIANADLSIAVNKEQLLEHFTTLYQALLKGNDMTPFVIGVKDGKPLIQRCEVDRDGTITLPDIKVNTEADIKAKAKVVKGIMRKITPVLQAEIENVTHIALMRKDMAKLKRVIHELQGKDIPVRLENRVGCIYVIIGDFEFLI